MLFSLSAAGHGFMMVEMSAKPMVMAPTIQMSPADPSMDCCQEDMGMGMTCFAICASTFATLSAPLQLPVIVAARDVGFAVFRFIPGRAGPPDPDPPKPFVLS